MSGEVAINSSFQGARGMGASVAENAGRRENTARKMKTADFTRCAGVEESDFLAQTFAGRREEKQAGWIDAEAKEIANAR